MTQGLIFLADFFASFFHFSILDVFVVVVVEPILQMKKLKPRKVSHVIQHFLERTATLSSTS